MRSPNQNQTQGPKNRFGPSEILKRYSISEKAKTFTKSLIPPGTRVRLEFEVQQRDRYGRLLAYVYLSDGRMLNEVLLEEGYATLLTIPPNVKYVEKLRSAQRRAIEKQKGLWSK